ncbi:MAG TPA: class I adenylate-forming enzyme family protein [Mycobacterium sp.]|nr:class I adenylate-forming enzyme family protein [Mycobacterium sp.]
MNVAMLLEMAAEGMRDRIAIGSRSGGLTYGALLDQSRRVASVVRDTNGNRLVFVGQNSALLPALVFGSGLAGVPFVPVNYRLADDLLRSLLARTAPALVVVDDAVVAGRVAEVDGLTVYTQSEFEMRMAAAHPAEAVPVDPDAIAVLLYTSGTTGQPKAAVLRHRHLVSYVISTVECMGAGDDEAALVSVPPYHVAGMAAVLTSVYSGRRVVYQRQFDAQRWVDVARDEAVTNAMVVPTMLGRILEVLEAHGEKLPALAHLAYGGGRMPITVIERALELLPMVGFVNAYGLTETASTIATLGPQDHRTAAESEDRRVRARLGSVGRPLPTVEVEIRGPDGTSLTAGQRGEIYVRGEQVSGEYLGRSPLGADGWFATRDAGWLDEGGFLFVEGRLDDVIVRGAENLSPGEVEDVLAAHPAVADAGVVGVPDDEWGESVAAAVVLKAGAVATVEELQGWVRARLRSSRTPNIVEFRDALPYNETGKLLRRVLRQQLGGAKGASTA